MRITQSMMQQNMMRHLFQSQGQMDKYLTQINTGKKNRFFSDDPIQAVKGIDYRSQISQTEQYGNHINEVWTWLEGTDDVLDTTVKVIGRLNDLAVQATNGSHNAEERKAIAVEAKQLKLQLVDLANAQVNGKYIFNGANTNEPPLEMVDGIIQFQEGNGQTFKMEVAKGIDFQVTGQTGKIFNESLFDKIDQFITGLEDNNQVLLDESIGSLQQGLDVFIHERAELGARMNRLELTEKRLEQQVFVMKDVMMKNEGVDFEVAVTNLLTQEVIQQAALASSARMIQPSLLDFLR